MQHEITIDGETKRLTLIRDERGAAMYSVLEEIPDYQPQLRFTQDNWIGGHGQYSFNQKDMYFEGQSIDTTQDGRIILGPLIYTVGISGATLGANPVDFCWFSASGTVDKLIVATATRVFWYDNTNFVLKWDRANHDWAASHSFTTADWVRPTTYNGHIYECTTAGTGGASEPSPWETTDGGTEVTGGATFTCRSITIRGMYEFNQVLFVALDGSDEYFYSADGAAFTESDRTVKIIHGFKGAPNPAGTANVLWGFVEPNLLYSNTNGTNNAVQWDSGTNVGDSSNDITNVFLVNDKLMIGKTDNLYHYDSDGGVHPLMDDLKHNRSAYNFKYVTQWQTGAYFSLGRGMAEITAYNAYEPMGALLDTGDIGKIGDCVGLASDKDWLFQVVDEGTNTIIYKGREVRREGLRWEWCSWVYLGANACATAKVVQHSATSRRLWFGYGNNAGYVILTDNPTTDTASRFAASGWIRMSYEYGTNKYWDELWQSIITETKACSSGRTVTPKYRRDVETSATQLTSIITKNGVRDTKLTNELDCKRIQFELHLATNSSSSTPEVLFFEARGIEKPETVRIHEAVYAIGNEPTKQSKTIRDFLRGGRESTSLIRFADLRYGDTTKEGAYVILMPGYPQEIELLHEKSHQPELGIRCRFQEVSFRR